MRRLTVLMAAGIVAVFLWVGFAEDVLGPDVVARYRALLPAAPGMVLVGNPEIYTRERLVNDRLEHAQWLDTLFERLRNDPASFRALDARYTARQHVELKAMNVPAHADTPAGAGGAATTAGTSSRTTSPSPSASGTASLGAAPQGTIEEPTLLLFNQMNRYRNLLRAERIRTMLDDRHDIEGNTVVQFNFDVTVVSGAGRRGGFGLVVVVIGKDKPIRKDEADDDHDNRFYRDWLHLLKPEVAYSIERRAEALLTASAFRIVPELQAQLQLLRAAVCHAYFSRRVTFARPEEDAVAAPLMAPHGQAPPISGLQEAELARQCLAWTGAEGQPTTAETQGNASSHWAETRSRWEEVERRLVELLAQARQDFANVARGHHENTLHLLLDDPRLLRLGAQLHRLRRSAVPPAAEAGGGGTEAQHELKKLLRPVTSYEGIVFYCERIDGRGKVPLLDQTMLHLLASLPPAAETHRAEVPPRLAVAAARSAGRHDETLPPEVLWQVEVPCPPVFGPREQAALLALAARVLQEGPHDHPLAACLGGTGGRCALRFAFDRLDPVPSPEGASGQPGEATSRPITIRTGPAAMHCAAALARRMEGFRKVRPTGSSARTKTVSLADLADLPILFAEDDQGGCTLDIRPHAAGPAGLASILNAIDGEVFAYGLVPRNETRMIGRDLTLAGALAIETALKATTAREHREHGYGEEPLIVGFNLLPDTDGMSGPAHMSGTAGKQLAVPQTTFGWVVRPRHRADAHPSADMEKLALSAVVSLPSWWRRLTVATAGCWIMDTADFEQIRRRMEEIITILRGADWREPQGCRMRRTVVKSPGSTQEVLRALRLEIIATPYLKTAYPLDYVAEVGRPASFRIEGGRLWRSTAVTLGGQMADRIVVLPNMMGIVAEFRCIEVPNVAISPAAEGFATVPLQVWTSEGVTEPLPVRVQLPRSSSHPVGNTSKLARVAGDAVAAAPPPVCRRFAIPQALPAAGPELGGEGRGNLADR